MSVSLPVSIGEALDKLSILDIKMARISDYTRKAYVHKEYTALYEILAQYVKKFQFHYKILYQLNDDMCLQSLQQNLFQLQKKNLHLRPLI